MQLTYVPTASWRPRPEGRCEARQNARAITRVDVVAVVGLLTVLFVLSLPLWANDIERSRRAVCANNLRRISIGFHSWAKGRQDRFPWVEFPQYTLNELYVAAGAELGAPWTVLCPSDERRTATIAFTNLTVLNCSYFLNVRSQTSEPANWLAGDRNLGDGNVHLSVTNADWPGLIWKSSTIHLSHGNICAVDGHVQQLSNRGLQRSAALVLEKRYRIELELPGAP